VLIAAIMLRRDVVVWVEQVALGRAGVDLRLDEFVA
jgi:hypothetical protein